MKESIMKKNIAIIGLVGNFKKNVAKALADKLELFFADVNDIMEFNLINANMIEHVGQDYFDKNETKTVKLLASYENTIITLNFSTLNKSNNHKLLSENCIMIYLRLSFNDFQLLNKIENYGALNSINKKMYKDRDALLTKMSDIVIEIEKVDLEETIGNILLKLSDFLEKK